MSPPLSVTFKMSTDEGQCGKQCNYKYLGPTLVLEKNKELELLVVNPLTNFSIAFFLWYIIKQINKFLKTQTKTNKPTNHQSPEIAVRHSLLKAGNLNETPPRFQYFQIQKEKIDIKVRRTPSQCHNATPLWGNLWRWDPSLPIHWHLIIL